MYLVFLSIAAIIIFLIPRGAKAYFSLLLNLGLAVLSCYYSVNVLISGINYSEILPFQMWGKDIQLLIDPVSALFILIINFTVITGALYSLEYLRMYKTKTGLEFSIHYFSYYLLQLSMIMVCMMQNVIAFMVVWELMALSSFMLVIFENEKSSVLKAGINYLIQMHIGALFLVSAFIILNLKTGTYTFDGLLQYFSTEKNFPLFLLFFIGFGIKAGFMPFHTWLPHAHPAAPSNISGVMSGVMIKLGIFGIIKVLMYLQHDILLIGVFILAISLLSGIGGVALAIIQHDLKKLLAYHSIENIGIIGIGLGIGTIGVALNNYTVAFLGFAGGLLHVLNHSLFKSLLFYSAGSVYLKTHTKNIESLGGIIKKMPVTAFLFLVASLAICGLPPFNGFISEFLIYNSFIEGLYSANIAVKVTMLFSMMGLAFIGGLAIFCFTKAFGIVFLGKARETDISEVTEVKWYSLFPQFLIFACILFIGLFPQIALKPFYFVVQNNFAILNSIGGELPSNVSIMQNVGLASGIFILVLLVLYFVKKIFTAKKTITESETWGCGYSGDAPKAQYTATSYAENYSFIAKGILNTTTKFHEIPPTAIFPKERSFETESEDIIENKVFHRFVKSSGHLFERFAVIQTGNTQHYILYAFVMIIVLIALTVLNLI
jgi:formate hydrogenlyase subunit 3/multisubunit Na+/H+ antiporter MnhD subunit